MAPPGSATRHPAFKALCLLLWGGWGSPNLEALHKRTSLTVSLTYGYIEYLDSIASLLPKNLGTKSVRLGGDPSAWWMHGAPWAPVPRWSKTPPGRRPTTRSCQDPAAWARREPPHRPSLLWYYLDGGGGSTKKRLLRMKVGRKMGVVENFLSRGKGRVPDWRKTIIWVSWSNSIFGFGHLWRSIYTGMNVEMGLQRRKDVASSSFQKSPPSTK